MKKLKNKQKNTEIVPALSDDNNGGDFSASISDAFRQKNEKNFLAGIIVLAAIILILLISALSDVLTLCFEVNRIFGYVMLVLAVAAVGAFIVRPLVKVLCARFFITDVTSDLCDMARRRNYRALRDISRALLEYNADPRHKKFKYLSDENAAKLNSALASRDKAGLKSALKKVYATDVAACANGLIWKNAGKAFLTTSVSQNDKIDSVSVLLINLSLVKQIVGVYGYRPSYAKLFRIYAAVLRSALIAYGMQNVNWFNVFGKFFTGVAKKLPFIDTVVDSAVQGTVSAFMTLLVGYKTKRYLCSDYKKQEKLDFAEGEANRGGEFGDEEVKIASVLAKKIQRENQRKTAENWQKSAEN